MKSPLYYVHMETKILADFEICISVPLRQSISWTPSFYANPKTHKEEISGRPVVSLVKCGSSKISEYVDYHLQQKILSYIKVTFFVN